MGTEDTSWRFAGHDVPRPNGLVLFDHAKQEINTSIIVVGSGADAFLQHVYTTTVSKGNFVDVSTPGEPSFLYLPVRLGDIRGWATRFHLYGVRADDRLRELLGDMLPHANAIVVARDDEDDLGDSVVGVTARLMKEHGRVVPVAMLTKRGEDREWARCGGVAPVYSGAMETTEVVEALKAVARGVLTALSRGE